MKTIWRWRRKIARRGILAALLLTTLLAGGCAYNGYYTDYPYYGDYYYHYSYPYYASYYPYSYPYEAYYQLRRLLSLLRLFQRVFYPSRRPSC